MAKIARKTAKIFGSSAGLNQISEFGSLAAASPAFSTDPSVIQSLSQWVTGWFSAVIGANSPAIEDMNAFCFVMAYQIAYILQEGVPEWDSGTTYFTGSVAQFSGVTYVSLVDNNLNNTPTGLTNWAVQGRSVNATALTTNTVLTSASPGYNRVDATSGAIQITLPALAAVPFATQYIIKKVDSSSNFVTVKGNAAELIDLNNTFALEIPGDSITVRSFGTVWDIT